MPDRRMLTTLLFPLRSYAARAAERADADAVAAGLTVEVLPGWVRRYRDPRVDQLPAHSTNQPPVTLPAPTGTDWSQPRLVVVAGWSQ